MEYRSTNPSLLEIVGLISDMTLTMTLATKTHQMTKVTWKPMTTNLQLASDQTFYPCIQFPRMDSWKAFMDSLPWKHFEDKLELKDSSLECQEWL